MKRSDMVEKIAEELLQMHRYGGDKEEREEVRDTTKIERILWAHNALKAAEKFGMLPPEACIGDNYGTEEQPLYLETYANEWEEEND
jgi:hypothetical protein